MQLKYIVVNNESPVIFPRDLVHADVACGLRFITSAGFCSKGPKGWDCWGRSESLDIDGKPSDAALLNRVFA